MSFTDRIQGNLDGHFTQRRGIKYFVWGFTLLYVMDIGAVLIVLALVLATYHWRRSFPIHGMRREPAHRVLFCCGTDSSRIEA